MPIMCSSKALFDDLPNVIMSAVSSAMYYIFLKILDEKMILSFTFWTVTKLFLS